MNEIILKTRHLPVGAKTKIGVSIGDKPLENKIVTFKKMDGMYGQRFDEDGEMFVFNADFKAEGDGFYSIISDEGTN